MASAFEGGSKELVHNLTGHIVVDKTTWHHEYVGIVVLTDEMCNLWDPAQTSAYLLVLVECDADTLTTTTDGNAGINLTTLDTFGQSVTKVWIIDTRIAPERSLRDRRLRQQSLLPLGKQFLNLIVNILTSEAELLVEHLVRSRETEALKTPYTTVGTN